MSLRSVIRPAARFVAPRGAGLFRSSRFLLSEQQIQALDAQGQRIEHKPLAGFADIESKIPGWLGDGIQSMKYVTPTDIQAHTVPFLLEGRDMIGLAPTGSGKTVAFALPSLALLEPGHRTPQVVVLCPVRELAQQTAKVFQNLATHEPGIKIRECFGGAPRPQQQRDIDRGCDVLVATPGRLVDFLQTGVVRFDALRFIVFDEADRLLDMGFTDALESIMSFVKDRQRCQTMMWSATWPDEVRKLAHTHLDRSHVMMRVGDGNSLISNKDITQKVFYCQNDDERMSRLADLYTSGKVPKESKALMFVLRKSECEAVAREVGEGLEQCCGVNQRYVGSLHGDMPQYHRDRVIRDFKEGRIRILVATDVAARGLDIPDVEFVFNYDAPHKMDSYCHRIGRTGRNGRKGTSFTFLMPETVKLAPDLREFMIEAEQEISEDLLDACSAARRSWQSRGGGRGGRGRGRSFGGGGGGGGYRGRGGGRGGGGGGYSGGGFGGR